MSARVARVRWPDPMPRTIQTLTSSRDLDAALAASATRPVFLFKHSETCGMSLQAYEEVLDAVAAGDWQTDVHLVSVQASRPVSREISVRLGVPHQSPQILLVAGGQVRWHTSHLAITGAALRSAVERALHQR